MKNKNGIFIVLIVILIGIVGAEAIYIIKDKSKVEINNGVETNNKTEINDSNQESESKEDKITLSEK